MRVCTSTCLAREQTNGRRDGSEERRDHSHHHTTIIIMTTPTSHRRPRAFRSGSRPSTRRKEPRGKKGEVSEGKWAKKAKAKKERTKTRPR